MPVVATTEAPPEHRTWSESTGDLWPRLVGEMERQTPPAGRGYLATLLSGLQPRDIPSQTFESVLGLVSELERTPYLGPVPVAVGGIREIGKKGKSVWARIAEALKTRPVAGRREFLKGAMAAPIAAGIPGGLTEAVQAVGTINLPGAGGFIRPMSAMDVGAMLGRRGLTMTGLRAFGRSVLVEASDDAGQIARFAIPATGIPEQELGSIVEAATRMVGMPPLTIPARGSFEKGIEAAKQMVARENIGAAIDAGIPRKFAEAYADNPGTLMSLAFPRGSPEYYAKGATFYAPGARDVPENLRKAILAGRMTPAQFETAYNRSQSVISIRGSLRRGGVPEDRAAELAEQLVDLPPAVRSKVVQAIEGRGYAGFQRGGVVAPLESVIRAVPGRTEEEAVAAGTTFADELIRRIEMLSPGIVGRIGGGGLGQRPRGGWVRPKRLREQAEDYAREILGLTKTGVKAKREVGERTAAQILYDLGLITTRGTVSKTPIQEYWLKHGYSVPSRMGIEQVVDMVRDNPTLVRALERALKPTPKPVGVGVGKKAAKIIAELSEQGIVARKGSDY